MLSGNLCKFAERKFDLLMSRIAVKLMFTGTEHRGDIVGITAHAVKKVPFPRCLEMGDRGFHEMTGAIKFMVLPELFPAVFRFHLREIGVQIAVRLLGGNNQINETVQLPLLFRIGIKHQGKCVSLHDFGKIRIPENMRLTRHTLFPFEFE